MKITIKQSLLMDILNQNNNYVITETQANHTGIRQKNINYLKNN